MTVEAGHFPNRVYHDNAGNLHLNGANLLVLSGSTIGADDASSITFTTLVVEPASDTLTAVAGGQGSALALTGEINRITTCPTGGGVLLPPSAAGLDIIVINHGAHPLQVFGAGTDTIDDVATATGVAQMVNSVTIYCCTTAGSWYSNGIGTGYAGGLPTVSNTEGLTANHSPATQAGGTAITTVLNRFTTVANIADAATLMVSAPGLQITVINAGANSMNIFPNAGGTTTETINALAANAAYALAATKTVTFMCTVAGQWHTLLSS